MQTDRIEAIAIDDEGSLWVKPATLSFPQIYRAAMEVRWDTKRGCLCSPKPLEWSYVRWFEQILAAASDEYGVTLKIDRETTWAGIDDVLRRELMAKAR